LLDPKLDLVFRMLFGNPDNEPLLLSLLNAVLSPPSPIETVRVLNPEVPRESIDEKGIVLDLRVDLADGQQIDVEMESQPRLARRERALYYWAKMYSGQLGRGEGYGSLCRCVVVLILDFAELAGQRFHSTFRVGEVHDGEVLSEQLELHLLELPKLGLAVAKNEEPELLGWGKFLTAESDDALESLAMTDPVFRGAKQALERLSKDPDARILAEQREMALRPYEVDLGHARKRGLAEGREEGRKEGRKEGREEGREEGLREGREEGLREGREEALRDVLVLQLASKFGEVPQALIDRIASASETDLKAWGMRLLAADSLERVFAD
jgi:predicted transposase/invertase (TIGR01784 family)